MIFLTFFIVPIFISVFFFIVTKQITFREFLLQLGIQFIVIGIFSFIIYNSNLRDTEVWNGFVTNKYSEKVSCQHSYKCFCRNVCSTSCKSKGGCTTSCHEVCQTCYEHRYDVSWLVENNIKERWHISRIDRQGLREPPRWTETEIGMPTSTLHSYDNYIKGSPDSLFKTESKNKNDSVPKYPTEIYDYWKLNRLALVGVSLQNKEEWSNDISKINALIGHSRQANLVLVITREDQSYFKIIERNWLGGKKNDIIPVIGVNDKNEIMWVEVMALSNENFKIELRNALLSLPFLDKDKVLNVIQKVITTSYIRKPMKDFEYLKASIQPTKGQWVGGLLISILLSLGLSFFFYSQDVFNEDRRRR